MHSDTSGRFKEALKALNDAETLFDETPASDPHDIAIVWFIRAMVLIELGEGVAPQQHTSTIHPPGMSDGNS